MKSLTWHLPTTVCHSLESLFQLTFSARSSPHLKVFALEANKITSKGFTFEVYGTPFLTNFFVFFTGATCLDGSVYCVGGSYGSTGSKYCFRLDLETKTWHRISDLHIGKSDTLMIIILVFGGYLNWFFFVQVASKLP